MGLLGLFDAKAHTNYPSKTGEAKGPKARPAPTRWLAYGFAALALLWAMGWVSSLLGETGRATSVGGTTAGTGGPAGLVGVRTQEPLEFTGRDYERALAAELANLLSRVQGAGRVEISVSLSRGPAYVFGYNTTTDTRATEERDSTGGARAVSEVAASQQPVILRDGAHGEKPLVAEEERPQVSGVLILAEGAADSRVRVDLVRAVQALFELPSHRITVLPMGR